MTLTLTTRASASIKFDDHSHALLLSVQNTAFELYAQINSCKYLPLISHQQLLY